jgi:hypothetical protein
MEPGFRGQRPATASDMPWSLDKITFYIRTKFVPHREYNASIFKSNPSMPYWYSTVAVYRENPMKLRNRSCEKNESESVVLQLRATSML